MPSVNKTPTLGLNQWEGNEYFKREDLVSDNALIDAAIKQDRVTLEKKADKESPQFTGTPTINGNEIATVNNIPAGLSLGETSSTAYRGDRGKVAYDHSQSAHAPSNAQKNSDITKAEIEAKLTGQISTHYHASDSTKAPTMHAVADGTYGLGTHHAYGHVKTYQGLDFLGADAFALHANQGKVLKDLIDTKGAKVWTKLGSYATIVATTSVPSGSITLPSNATKVMFEIVLDSLANTNIVGRATYGNNPSTYTSLFEFSIYKFDAGEPDSSFLRQGEIPSWTGELIGDYWHFLINTGSDSGNRIPGVTGIRLHKSKSTIYFWLSKTATINVYYK